MNDPAATWLRLARRLCRKVNFAFWLDCAAVPVVVMAGMGAGALLLVRHYWPDVADQWLIPVTSSLLVAAMCGSWWRSRKRFIGIDEALVRLEVRRGLHAALSTARAGAGEWPPVPASVDDGLGWRWGRAGLPPLLAAGLVAAAWMLPVTARPTASRVSEPAAWGVVEADLQTLVEERVVDEPSTQETRKAIEALRERPQGEWFNHSSIEAGDRILLTHRRDMAALEAKMREVARSLRQAADPRPGNQNQAGQPALDAAFSEMVEGLRNGSMRPDAELMDKLSQLAAEHGSSLNQLDPQQIAQLLERMEENARLLAEMGEQLEGMPGFTGECAGGGENGEGPGAEGQNDRGRGAPARGPGEGGPLFGGERDAVDATLHKPLPAGDLSRAAPGDMVGESEARHEVDAGDSPMLRSGGAPVQPGDGGGAVWSDTLHPSEQRALRRFFE